MHLRSASCQNALRPYSCQDAQVRASPCQIDPSALSPCPTGRSSSTCSTPLVHRDAAAARWSHRDSCSLAAVSRSASTCCSLEFPGVRRDRQRASHAERRIVHLPKVHRTESLASKSPPVLVIQHHNAAPALSAALRLQLAVRRGAANSRQRRALRLARACCSCKLAPRLTIHA